MTISKRKHKTEHTNLLNILNEKSLDVLRNFGHIYRGPNSGKLYMRPYKNINNKKYANNNSNSR